MRDVYRFLLIHASTFDYMLLLLPLRLKFFAKFIIMTNFCLQDNLKISWNLKSLRKILHSCNYDLKVSICSSCSTKSKQCDKIVNPREIEANPTYAIMILYKYGVFAEAIDIPSLVPHIVHEDKENSKLF